MCFFSEKTNSSATVKVSYIEGRTEVHQDDLIIFALPVFSNKRYLIKMSATAEIRLVLVVKVHSKPELLDIYGGDSISKNATLLVIDFAAKSLLWRAYSHPATGLEYVLKEANSTCVSLVGTLHSKEEKTMLYFAVMPAVYDEVLCKRCMAISEGPCGFCSGKERTTAGTVLDVKVTTIVYMADCVFWSQNKGEWRHDGCEVNEVQVAHIHTLHIITHAHARTHACTTTPNNNLLSQKTIRQHNLIIFFNIVFDEII